ncbi:hypothetical protein LJR289_001728 [Pseudoduganella sp. LjRoot289]|uniref:hypothetical protein n=1 Tax=Pseudoduganella sp. LjRoot289 TaxID=3342314 RepID=UPI003ED159F7
MTHHKHASRARFIAGCAVHLALAALATSLPAAAADNNPFELVENKPLGELWINPGFYSYHFDRERNLNDRNPGIGAEYRFSTVAAATAGRFYNSDRQYSNYAGVYYQPLAIGPVRLGAVVGGFSGYPKMRDGGWFLAAIPVLSVEYQRVGANIAVIPRYKDRLYGALSIQLKFKLSE